eukprot:Blabericola_migrator_1__5590@NODE_2846_length_2294_cov_5_066906_g1784_i0_p1_GENE_NODE_2846_length_2294_cov_5_066906_g1784_i0NODE_2846_length_2294_cov_5_066906_g1784_i0_p1_ORF_typecomplete_len485_score63_55FAD_binding_4/PF01565_23/4_5e33BBE/PF08031_12/0_0044_NODE_2846_length_2294_cov_5_066906_g1784_i06592113
MLRYLLPVCVSFLSAFASDALLRACLVAEGLNFKWNDESHFEEWIEVINTMWKSHPSVVVRAANTSDVSKSLQCAQLDNRVVTARSGGHSYGGFSRGMNNGMVIDLRAMHAVTVDPHREVVEFEPGVKLSRLLTALDDAGHYVVPAGTCPGVGAVGLTLGGGRGPLSRHLGMMSDNVVSMEVVLADGSIAEIDHFRYPDLFNAMRGAGTGNFAIATKIKMKIHKLTQVSWRLYFAPETVGHAVGCVSQWVHHAPSNFGTLINREDDAVTKIWILYYGAPHKMDRELKPLEACIPSLKSVPTHEASSYMDVYALYTKVTQGPEFDTREKLNVSAYYKEDSQWSRAFSIEGKTTSPALAEVIDEASERAPPGAGLIMELAGGKINQMSPTKTAYPHRDTNIHITISLHTDGEAPPASSEHWARQLADKLHALLGPGGYYNKLDAKDHRHPGFTYFGNNIHFLKYVAAKYDPFGRFWYPMSVINMRP